MRAPRHGCVHIYTGNGKGKSTAAFGLAVRASGAGMRVLVLQFIKGRPYSEIGALRKLPRVTVRQFGRGCFIRGGSPRPADIACAGKGLDDAMSQMGSGRVDMVILDELNVALGIGIVPLAAVVRLIDARPKHVELILTGRGCPRGLYRYADYVTEMREVKHPYRAGLLARKGIEC